ncbi:hypothetical protein AK830_g1278 [Neonectria ditissima]|uniref:Cellulose-binding protein n=1 Tax=Neonectria ditissima TaxID=78410 RepID=A0A0P7C047_9HYPO|nr:hypothetical protein AK830_g1278 [Neonectria ditissima]
MSDTDTLASKLQQFSTKPRVFVLSDISNEPDDAESLVRYLTYANQFETEGLVPTTSVWLRDKTCPEEMHRIVDGYAAAVANLNAHAHPLHQYPSAEHMRSLIRPGAPVYGMAAVGDDVVLSEGGKLLKERIEASQVLSEPLWILCWGGANVLAQALYKIRQEYDVATAAALRSKIRVYAISDQDDTSAWIRREFPEIFYISSVHAWNQYGLATWAGISGETHYGFDQGGPDGTKISKEWVKDNIQIGPLGSTYPDPEFVFEGDTPTFLYLIQNGLGSREHPHFGSWGGRYAKTDPSDNVNHYGDSADRVEGLDGRVYKSNQATIWRWRDAFQNDFAARIQWSMTGDFSKVNHHPVVSLENDYSPEPFEVKVRAGHSVILDASRSYDPDGDELTFRWFQYEEPSIDVWSAHRWAAKVELKSLNSEQSKVEVQTPSADVSCVEFKTWKPLDRGQVLHVVLEVKDSGVPQLTTYRRILIQTIRD